jgi:hypothetical protein
MIGKAILRDEPINAVIKEVSVVRNNINFAGICRLELFTCC